MEFFAMFFVLQYLLFHAIRTTDGRSIPLSSNGETRRYGLHDLDELVKELQERGAVPPEVLATPETTAKPKPSRRHPRIDADEKDSRAQKKLTKLQRVFKKAYGNPGSVFKGETVYSLRRWDRLRFDVDPEKYTNVVSGELRLYKLPLKAKHRRRGFGALSTKVHIFNTPRNAGFLSGAKIVDSQVVRLSKSGWVTFDITAALQQWQASARAQTLDVFTDSSVELQARPARTTRQYIEVWIESTELGRKAARSTKNMKFVQTQSRKYPDKRPQLEIFYTRFG